MTAQTRSPADSARRRALLAFVLPMVIFMIAGSLEPQPPQADASQTTGQVDTTSDESAEDAAAEDAAADAPSDAANWLGVPGKYYPVVYTVKIAVVIGVLLWALPVYLQWPLRISPLAVVVGVVGGGLWLGCCWLDLEGHLVAWLGTDHPAISWLGLGPRPAYNPLASLGEGWLGYGFLAVRFVGLVLLVPVIEEAFLRAFLMRFVMHDNWNEIPFGVVNRVAVAVGILLPVLYHPEKLAALVWFSLVTWLMVRTKNFWDCVAAHAITNGILGATVVATGWWSLW